MKKELKVLALASLLLPAFFVASSETATAQQPRRVIVIPRTPVAQTWVPGHYVRRGRDYIWVNGYYRSAPAPVRYTSAPARYKTWNPGYWRQTPRGRVWVEGFWSY